jgi:predicted dehydrogenase
MRFEAIVMPKHSVLVIGCGSIGERHLRCFQHTGRAEVAGCDALPALNEKMAATYRVPVFADWSMAIASGNFNAVVICTPAHLHVPIATASLKARLHTFVEKPLSQSFTGVKELLALPERKECCSAVAYVMHQSPLLNAAREFLQRGELGRVLQVSHVSGQPFDFYRPAYANTYYRDRTKGGGAIQDALTHSANWIESIVGPADSVLCDCAHLALPGVEVEDTVHVSSRHGGVMVSHVLNQFQYVDEWTVQFNCARGSVRIEDHHSRWGVAREKGGGWDWRNVAPGERDTPYLTQAHAFLDQIEGRGSRLCTLEAAMDTLRFNLAALNAAETGRTEAVEKTSEEVAQRGSR